MAVYEFKYDITTKFVEIIPEEDKYKSLGNLGWMRWQSDIVKEDIELVKTCKVEKYKTKEGFNSFEIGLENSPGRILVANNGPAWVVDGWDINKTYMTLELDEVLDFLYQLRDYLLSQGI